MQIPCVCSKIGELEKVVIHGENGLLAENKEEFKESLKQLINDKSLRDRIGKIAREIVVDKYSLDTCMTVLNSKLLCMRNVGDNNVDI